MSVQVEIPDEITERIRALCLALLEVTVRTDLSLTSSRSTAYSFDVGRRSFCLLVTREDPAGQPAPLLVLRAGPGERDALLSAGHPVFALHAGRDRMGVLLTRDTDRAEIGELVIDNYRTLAPKKLIARLG